jgi:hypothetical protein
MHKRGSACEHELLRKRALRNRSPCHSKRALRNRSPCHSKRALRNRSPCHSKRRERCVHCYDTGHRRIGSGKQKQGRVTGAIRSGVVGGLLSVARHKARHILRRLNCMTCLSQTYAVLHPTLAYLLVPYICCPSSYLGVPACPRHMLSFILPWRQSRQQSRWDCCFVHFHLPKLSA